MTQNATHSLEQGETCECESELCEHCDCGCHNRAAYAVLIGQTRYLCCEECLEKNRASLAMAREIVPL